MSLDGYIAEADDTIEWLTGYEGSYDGGEQDPGMAGYDGFYAEVGALVSGSVTYEFVLDHLGESGEWPYPDKPYWVLSTRDLATPAGERADVRIADAPAAELHAEMLAAAGEGNLWVIGGGNVASQLADSGLIDEVLLTVVPVILGAGKPLFDRPPPGGPMRLTGTRPFANGMVELSYEL